jgi:hypothetical protein
MRGYKVALLNTSKEKKRIVVSQSMYFPWVGLLEQIRLADVVVHYDDVQFARGFCNRVQVKTPNGPKWLTIPLRDYHRGQQIDEVLIDDRADWRSRHRDILRQCYSKAPFCGEMLALVDEVFSVKSDTLADLSRESLLALVRYFDLTDKTQFLCSRDIGVGGSSSQRLHDICIALGASEYVTGHGAKNYLDHQIFEKSEIRVQYMDYQLTPYPQLQGDFTPYVSGLDLVANCGKKGVEKILSQSIYWRNLLNGSD